MNGAVLLINVLKITVPSPVHVPMVGPFVGRGTSLATVASATVPRYPADLLLLSNPELSISRILLSLFLQWAASRFKVFVHACICVVCACMHAYDRGDVKGPAGTAITVPLFIAVRCQCTTF